MYRNKWTCLAWNAVAIFAGNLLTRPFIVPDKPLFSWNIPICVVLILIMWPITWYLNELGRKRIEKLERSHAEVNQVIEDLMASTRRRNEAEAMRLVDEFLKHPETGVRRGHP